MRGPARECNPAGGSTRCIAGRRRRSRSDRAGGWWSFWRNLKISRAILPRPAYSVSVNFWTMLRKKVVVIGGGFAGLWAVRALARAPVDITLVDRSNHHLFQPLLYQVATAGLAAPSIAAPLRHILRGQRNVTVLMGEVRRIDVAARRVVLADGSLDYDYLLVASGATHAYFGRDHWAAHAPGLKTLDDAFLIRRRVLSAFERAEGAANDAERAACLTFAVVGAGPTGVELAGTLAEIARHTLARDFRHIDPRKARVLLVEAGPR